MFGSGSTDNIARPEQKPLGLDARRLATNEQARPVPLVYGKTRVGVTFISQAFNQRAEPVTRKVGKKSEPVTTGYNYRCDFAGLICHGPVDSIDAIYFDDEKVWPDEGDTGLTRGANASDTIPITNFGVWTLYWGTEAQTLDALLGALWNAGDETKQIEEHTAYAGFCYFVANQQFLGYQKTNVQQIEVVVTRNPSKHFGGSGEYDAWLTNATIGLETNPVMPVVDLLVNARYGIGLADTDANASRLNRAAIQVVASRLKEDGIGISPVITRQQSITQILAGLLEYADAWRTLDTAGRFTLGVNRAPAAGTAIPALDELAFVDPPTITNPGYASTSNRVAVRFTNRDTDYKEDAAESRSGSSFVALSNPSPETLDRPWITDPNIATQQAGVLAKVLASPKISGSGRVRKSRLQGIDVGSLFLLHWSHWGLCNLRCRVTAIEFPDPFSPHVDLEWEVDRTHLAGVTFGAPVAVAPKRIVNAKPNISKARVIEMPYHKDLSEAPRIGFLVARPSKMVANFVAHYRMPDGSYRPVVRGGSFAFTGTLTADYSATASSQIELTLDGIEASGDLPNPTSHDAVQDQWALIVESSDGLDEIMSPQTLEVVSGTQAKYTVLRERWDTAKRAHVAGDRWWLIPASSLAADAWAHDGDTTQGVASDFKITSSVLGREGDIAAATPVSVTLTDRARRPWKPKSVAASLSSFNAASTISFAWTQAHRQGLSHSAIETPGVTWIVEFRVASEAVGGASTREWPGLLWEAVAFPDISGTGMLNFMGIAAQSVRVRVFARSGLYDSRHADEFLLTYSP